MLYDKLGWQKNVLLVLINILILPFARPRFHKQFSVQMENTFKVEDLTTAPWGRNLHLTTQDMDPAPTMDLTTASWGRNLDLTTQGMDQALTMDLTMAQDQWGKDLLLTTLDSALDLTTAPGLTISKWDESTSYSSPVFFFQLNVKKIVFSSRSKPFFVSFKVKPCQLL